MINVLTYTVPHRKTYDTLCLLKASGYHDVTVWAKPLGYVKSHKPLIEHRPECFDVPWLRNDLRSVSKNLGFENQKIMRYEDITEDGVFLVCGAGLLPEHFVKTHTIINAHPGYIPNVRGLDAFKWAIYEGQPVGSTTHLIGDEIDAGEIIERRIVPIYDNDTFHRAAQRVYETEIAMLVKAIELLDKPREYIGGEGYSVHRRMSREYEGILLEQFEQYKKAYRVVGCGREYTQQDGELQCDSET